jgi:hypothetical protein
MMLFPESPKNYYGGYGVGQIIMTSTSGFFHYDNSPVEKEQSSAAM